MAFACCQRRGKIDRKSKEKRGGRKGRQDGEERRGGGCFPLAQQAKGKVKERWDRMNGWIGWIN